MQLFIQYKGAPLTLTCEVSCTIRDVKAVIEQTTHIPVASQRIDFGMKQHLQDTLTLQDYGVGQHATLILQSKRPDASCSHCDWSGAL